MFSNKLASALAAAALLSTTAAQSSLGTMWIPTPTATLPARALETIGCFSTGYPLDNHGIADMNTEGKCQQICIGLNKGVMGLMGGENCWCGDLIPPKDSQVDKSECNTKCPGYDIMTCGGRNRWMVLLTGADLNQVDYASAVPSSSSSSSSAAASSSTAAPSSSVPEAAQSASQSAAASDGGPNKVGIAVGVVVGVIALAAIVGGVIFYLRQKRRREVEEEYRRQAAVNSFVAGGKLHTSNSSVTDSRLDPEFMNRRQSNGSIADNEDYSRRILKVTNA